MFVFTKITTNRIEIHRGKGLSTVTSGKGSPIICRITLLVELSSAFRCFIRSDTDFLTANSHLLSPRHKMQSTVTAPCPSHKFRICDSFYNVIDLSELHMRMMCAGRTKAAEQRRRSLSSIFFSVFFICSAVTKCTGTLS